MKPDFEKFRTKSSGNPASVRIPDELQKIAELIANVEDDSLSGIIIEGLARVIDDRRSNPSYMQSLLEAREAVLIETRVVLGLDSSISQKPEA
jgi:hypothetical protein